MANEDRQWHLDKKLNVGHLMTTLTLAAGVFIWASGIEQQINSNTAEIAHTKELLKVEQRHIKESMGELDKKLDKLDIKIDRLLNNMPTSSNGR